MTALSEDIKQAWENRQGPIIFATTDEDGTANIIYATCVSLFGDDCIVIADNYFDKTRKNILRGGRGSVLFMTKDNKAYQVKGELQYHKEGEIFDDMKKWNPTQHPGHAAAALKVSEVYSGATKLC